MKECWRLVFLLLDYSVHPSRQQQLRHGRASAEENVIPPPITEEN